MLITTDLKTRLTRAFFATFGFAVEVGKETGSHRLHHLAIRATGHES